MVDIIKFRVVVGRLEKTFGQKAVIKTTVCMSRKITSMI